MYSNITSKTGILVQSHNGVLPFKKAAFNVSDGLMVPQQPQYHCHNNPGSTERTVCQCHCNSTSTIELHELSTAAHSGATLKILLIYCLYLTSKLEKIMITLLSLSYLDKKFDIRVSVLTVSGHDARFWLSPWFFSPVFFFKTTLLCLSLEVYILQKKMKKKPWYRPLRLSSPCCAHTLSSCFF